MVEPLFFFGAGASRPFDIPTMKEMVPEFQKELANSSSKRGEEVRMYENIASLLKKAFGRVDLESVFTVVDAIAQGRTLKDLGYFATFLATDPSKKLVSDLLLPPPTEEQETAQRLRTKFEGYVKKVCWVKPDKLSSILSTYLAFFDAVFSVTGGVTSQIAHEGRSYDYNQFWNFFTTNYDNVLEVLWRSSIRQTALNTGFQYDQASKSEIWNPQALFQQNLRLIKLHGSVTWWREESTGRIVERDQPPDAAYLPRKFGAQIILYPIQQKDAFVPPYFDMFYVLRQALSEARTWIVIGYSFGDEIIRGMLARASTPTTRLVLVHPDAEASKQLEAEPDWTGQIRHVKTKFGELETNAAVAQALR